MLYYDCLAWSAFCCCSKRCATYISKSRTCGYWYTSPLWEMWQLLSLHLSTCLSNTANYDLHETESSTPMLCFFFSSDLIFPSVNGQKYSVTQFQMRIFSIGLIVNLQLKNNWLYIEHIYLGIKSFFKISFLHLTFDLFIVIRHL